MQFKRTAAERTSVISRQIECTVRYKMPAFEASAADIGPAVGQYVCKGSEKMVDSRFARWFQPAFYKRSPIHVKIVHIIDCLNNGGLVFNRHQIELAEGFLVKYKSAFVKLRQDCNGGKAQKRGICCFNRILNIYSAKSKGYFCKGFVHGRKRWRGVK